MRQGEVNRHAAAKRVAHEMGAVDLQGVHQHQQIIGRLVGLIRYDRLTERSDVEPDDAIARSERGLLTEAASRI